jgi:carbon-monoxide dehydrogenase medium subunit
MKFPPFDYLRPTGLPEACEMLAEEGARPLGGGQSLLPLMALRLARPRTLVDLGALEELVGTSRSVSAGEGVLEIGAMTTLSAVEHDRTACSAVPLLSRIVRFIGHPAIRHRGTLGGSIAHADPAAELPAACIALDASASIASRRGSRSERVEALVTGPYQTSLREDELVTGLCFPIRPGRRTGVWEVAPRPGDFALAGAICVVYPEHSGPAGAAVTFFGVQAKPSRVTLDVEGAAGEGGGRYFQDLADSLEGVLEDGHADDRFRRRLAAVAARRAFAAARGCPPEVGA